MVKKKKTVNQNPNKHSQELRMIYHFADMVSVGFSEEGWTEASRLLAEISTRVSPEVRHELGELWSTCYVTTDSTVVDDRVNSVVECLMNS
jgi:hypothetical protein